MTTTTPAPVQSERNCSTCAHKYKSEISYPCSSCIDNDVNGGKSWALWEAATASVAEMRPECDSSKLCAVHGSCAGQYGTEKQCGAAQQAVPSPFRHILVIDDGMGRRSEIVLPADVSADDRAQRERLGDRLIPVYASPTAAAAPDPLFLLHCGHIDSDGEQDRWDCEADSGARVDEFARKHPGQTVKLYAHPAPEVATDPALWQYRWANPGNNPDVALEDMGWREVAPERIEELRAYRYDGKPIYEIRALYDRPAAAAATEDGARLLWLIRDAGIDGWAGSKRDRYDVAQEVAAQAGREEANDSDELTAIRMLIDSTRA